MGIESATGGNQAPALAPSGATADKEKRGHDWAVFCHLAALLGFIGFPFGSVVGPLIVWLVKKDEYLFVDEQGREALNFQLSMLVYSLGALLLFCFFIGLALLPALKLLNLVFAIVAAINAGQGKPYRYPIAIPFLRK